MECAENAKRCLQFIGPSAPYRSNSLRTSSASSSAPNPSITLSTNNYKQVFFYRADLANWEQVNDLEMSDGSPFPEEFDEFLIIGLADRINVRNGVTMATESVQRFKKLRGQFYSRYAQITQVPVEIGLQRLPSNKAYRNFDAYTWGSFQRGIPWW